MDWHLNIYKTFKEPYLWFEGNPEDCAELFETNSYPHVYSSFLQIHYQTGATVYTVEILFYVLFLCPVYKLQ